MKKSILFAFAMLFCLSAFCGEGWSDCFRFDGNEITEEEILLKPTDELTYCSAIAEGDPRSLTISVEDTFDTSVSATIFSDTSGTAVEGTVCWDYTDDYYKDFPIDDTYVLTETVTSSMETRKFNRTVTILPEPLCFLLVAFFGLVCLRKRMKNLVAVLAVIIFSVFSAKADCLVSNVKCLQNWPFDRSVIINYTIESNSVNPYPQFSVKFYYSLNGGLTSFELSECGVLSRDGSDGIVDGVGEHKTIWTPDESFYFTKTGDMQVIVEATELAGLSQTFKYKLTPKTENTLPVFTTVFYGKDSENNEYLLEDIGTISGEGVTGIVLGKGHHQITWYPLANYTNLVGKLELRVEWEDVTDKATYLVLDLESYKMRTALQGPMEDASVWSNDTCRTSELWLRRIEPGIFIMGSPEGEIGREEWFEAQRIVTLTRAYYIGVFEITNIQCEKIAGYKGYSRDTRPIIEMSYETLRGSKLGASWPKNHEVDQYSYHWDYIEEDDNSVYVKSQSFFYTLREKTGNMLFDLPTEARWEYACRAGTTTSWNNGTDITDEDEDDNLDELGWYVINSDYESQPVGLKKPNAWGLYDMHGNVWEWCLDYAEEGRSTDAVIDPRGRESGYCRFLRGGSSGSDASECRSASADYDDPSSDYCGGDIGFRVVLDLDEDSLKSKIDYTLVSESSNTLPVFTTVFYGKDSGGNEYLLEDIGKLSGDGATGIALGAGKHSVFWEPKDAYIDLLGDLEFRVVSEDVTEKSKYLVLDLNSYKMRTALQGPMEDENIRSDNKCRTSEIWLRRIEPGTFMMGSPENELGRYDDEVQHKVTLTKAYYIGVFETTQKQFVNIVGFNNSYYKGNLRPVDNTTYYMLRGNYKGDEWPKNYEVDKIGSYYYYDHERDDSYEKECPAFFYALREKTGNALTFDLPTEAQWEYACRAGTSTALNDGTNLTNKYEDGNLNKLGRYFYNCSDSRGGYTNAHTIVGSYLPNDWGLYDMHGNVHEWCLDRYESFNSDDTTDPRGPLSGRSRIIRSGDYEDAACNCRSADRSTETPSGYDKDTIPGFRIVLVHEEEDVEEENVPLMQTFDYTLVSELSSTLPVFSTTFYGKDGEGHEYLLEDIGKISGEGSSGIALGEGKHQLIWEPQDAYTNLIGKLELRVESEDVTALAKYLVLDLSTYKMRTALQGPMEDESIWSGETCRTSELWLRRIEPGTFMMGSPEDELGRYDWGYEQQHEVTLTKAYYIGVFETTQIQFNNLTGLDKYRNDGYTRPANNVSYYALRGDSRGTEWPKNHMVDKMHSDYYYGDCPTFFYSLREKTGNGLTFDLPTEAQWEYACRAGTTTSWNDGTNITNKYSDANLNRLGRYYYDQNDGKGDSTGLTTTVGSYLPNAWGLYDMHGNVSEWCLDWSASYLENATDPKGPENGYGRVVRGGNYNGYAQECRSASRMGWTPGSDANGFRVVLVR